MATSISTRTEHGEQEELDGGVDPPGRVAPDTDEEVHGDEHHFPEDVEEEKVQGGEHPDHAAHQGQQANHELFDMGLDVGPGGQNTERGQKGGEQDEQQREAIHPEMIADAVTGNPRVALHELHGGGAVVEAEPQGQGEGQLQQGDPEGGRL